MDLKSKDINVARRRDWLVPLMWLLLSISLAALFGHNLVEMWARWFPAWRHSDWSLYTRIIGGESYYTHGPLVLLVSAVSIILLIRHTRLPLRPSPVLGFAVLVLSLAVHLMACLARVSFASGFAIIGVLAGLVLLFWGVSALRRLWFPLAFLAFMVPLPEVTIAQLNFRMKMLAAEWGVDLANLFGVVAERSGNRVFLEGGKSLVIANVCNGLRTLISVLAFGALYAYVCKLRGLWRLGLFVLAVPVAIASNSLRIVGLILVANIWDEKVATGWYHDFSGAMIFVLAFLMMFGLERLVLGFRKRLGRPAKILPLFYRSLRGPEDEGQWSKLSGAVKRGTSVMAVVLVLFAAACAWRLNLSVPFSGKGTKAAAALPRELEIDGQPWHGYDLQMDELTLTILETRDYLDREYVTPGSAPVNFTVIFSEDNRKGIHPPDLCVEGAGEEIIGKGDLVVPNVEGRGEVRCRELLAMQSNQKSQYYLYTYKCGSQYTNSYWRQQFVIFSNGLLNTHASGALIRVSTAATGGNWNNARERAIRFMQIALPYLDRSLP